MSRKYKKHFGSCAGMLLAVCVLLMVPGGLYAQNNANGNGDMSVSINVSANVVSATEVTMVTLRDMILDRQVRQENMIVINPVQHAQAGQMRAEGEPQAEVRISFLEERELTREGGPEQLTFYYEISGNEVDDQPSSEILDLDNRDFELNEDGEFYFWIGGYVDISDAVQGSYEGEFTIEIEYL